MKKKLLLILLFVWVSSTSIAQNEGWAICNSGANLYFKIVGSGNPVLVVSDVGHSSGYLNELIKRLSENNRVVYYDARATGKSNLPLISDSTVNFNKAVADIEGLRMVLRIPKWSVIAHGFGAKIACAYAAQAGEHLGQLVLINPSSMDKIAISKADDYLDTDDDYGFSGMLSENTIGQRIQKLQNNLYSVDADSPLRDQAIIDFRAAVYVYDTLQEPIAAKFLYEKKQNIAIKSRVSSKFVPEPFDCINTLRQRGISVMVLLSQQRHHVEGTVNYWKRSLPNVALFMIEKAHHFPWLDNPTAFYGHINPFLQRFIPEEYASQKETNRPIRRGYQRRKRY